MNDELNAKKSLCWRCKHGMCVQETEQEKVMYADMPSEQDLFPMGDTAYNDGKEEITERVIEHARIKTICFWRPSDVTTAPPIGVANVTQCNRFEDK